jgi:hypothetical protein
MDWTRSGDDLFVRLDPGEEIHTSLREIADKVGFDAAAITSGIGRTRDNAYGHMSESGNYHRVEIAEACELVSLQGNIARLNDGSAFTHIHVTISDDEMGVHAGHLFNAVVEVVAEIHLRIMQDVMMTRCAVENSSFIALKFE